MITYRDIYEAAKKERYSENLQPISKSFIRDMGDYLKEKRKAASREDVVFSDSLLKTKKQLENAITLFQELMRHRRKKILKLVLIASVTGVSKQDFDNMLLVEKSLFEEMVECVEGADRRLNEILNGKKEKGEVVNIMIMFLDSIEEFVAPDGEKYGPYSSGDFANVPKEVADIFIGEGKAEVMDK